MAELVYILCAVTSLACAILLGRAYRRSRHRVLWWSTWCFVGLALTNVLTFVDLIVVPQVDLHWVRASVGLVALVLLAVGLVWEAP
ncbi:MAG: DUF5985 family protein [Acidobacteriota bacterium]